MEMPPSVTKVTGKGITFTSNVDRCKYTLDSLIRAAYHDIQRLVLYRIRQKFNKLKGMRKNSKYKFRKTFQYWARKRDKDLILGIRTNHWYGAQQELGDRNQPKRDLLRGTVMENLDDIIKISAQYVSSVEDEAKALGIIESAEGELDDKPTGASENNQEFAG